MRDVIGAVSCGYVCANRTQFSNSEKEPVRFHIFFRYGVHFWGFVAIVISAAQSFRMKNCQR